METEIGGATIAILLGLLLGLERERARQPDEKLFAGIRTFPILALCGYLGAMAVGAGATFALPALLVGVSALAVAAYWRSADAHPGATTEVTALLTCLLGALVYWGHAPLAAALAVVVTLLLTLKAPLHKIAGAVTEEEIISILKFGLVAVVLVPLLPEKPFGPFGAIVPRHVGLVVVIVSGVSLLGYLLVRILGGRTGWALAGLLGGLVSSTAVTLSFAGKGREVPAVVRPLAAGVLLASMMLYARGFVLLGLFDPPLAFHLAPRLGLLFLVAASFALWELRERGPAEKGGVGLGNPVELGRAVGLGLLFAAILLGARAAQAWLGTTGLWVAGLLGGLADVDSVAVTAARLRQQGLASEAAAGGTFLLASLSNLVVKAGIVVVAGGGPLCRRVLPGFGALAAATLAVLLM